MGTYSWPDSSWMARITSSAIARRARRGRRAGRLGAATHRLADPELDTPGRGTKWPGGSTRPVPNMPTGITGRPDFSASQPTPGRPRYSRPSGELVPSG